MRAVQLITASPATSRSESSYLLIPLLLATSLKVLLIKRHLMQSTENSLIRRYPVPFVILRIYKQSFLARILTGYSCIFLNLSRAAPVKSILLIPNLLYSDHSRTSFPSGTPRKWNYGQHAFNYVIITGLGVLDDKFVQLDTSVTCSELQRRLSSNT
jgi:hypothetical protein